MLSRNFFSVFGKKPQTQFGLKDPQIMQGVEDKLKFFVETEACRRNIGRYRVTLKLKVNRQSAVYRDAENKANVADTVEEEAVAASAASKAAGAANE